MSAELAARIPEAILSDDDESRAVVGEAERRASTGCSVAARALVNARDTLVELAIGESLAGPPSSRLRRRVLEGAMAAARVASPRADEPEPPARGGAAGPPLGQVDDASASVARLHVGTPEDLARARDVDAMVGAWGAVAGADESLDLGPLDSAPLHRLLSQIAGLLGYRLALVALLRGEHAYHPSALGKTPDGVDFRRIPRELTFCTHCVSSGGPVRVENAVREPFFRGNRLVWGFGARAYAGVPLVSSTGHHVGTLCCIHDEPRVVPDEHLQVLGLYAERAVAELERRRAPSLRAALVDEAVSTSGEAPPFEVAHEAWFRRLLDIEVRRARNLAPYEASRVVQLRIGGEGASSSVEEGDVVGHVGLELGVLRARADAPAWGASSVDAPDLDAWIAASKVSDL